MMDGNLTPEGAAKDPGMQKTSLLQQRILERIRQEGPITFADYMRMALYEPGYGYYVTGETRIGWDGDFYTSTDVADFFAHCMGRQLLQMWEVLGKPEPFMVLEQGSGRGDLATTIRAWAAQECPAMCAALEYRTADINAGLDALQSDMKASDDPFSPMVILSNELVDAFPVHIVQKYEGALYELYVTEEDGHLAEGFGEPCSTEVAGYLDHYKIPWHTYEDGWRAEVNLAALSWMERTSQLLMGPNPKRKRHGFILAIDYGDSAKKLYTQYRHHGTLACYYQHQLAEHPLMRPGKQDITAHVNFSALIEIGRQQGLRLHAFSTQSQWLTDMGIYDELERIRQRDFGIIDQSRSSDQGQIAMFRWYNLRQRVSTLTEPAGMGNFKVLILKR